MNRLAIVTPAVAAAILCTLPVLAQENPNQGGFVTLDLNWTQGSAPAESELDGDTMRQILERDEARVRMIQQRAKPLNNNDAAKADEKKEETKTVTTPVAPPDESRMTRLSGDQMRQIVERDRARAKAMGERVRAAQAEAEAEKYLEDGQTPEDGGQGGLTCYSPLGSQRGSHDLVRNSKQPFIHVNATLSACPPSPHPDAHKSTNLGQSC